jgi:hypothetical protein
MKTVGSRAEVFHGNARRTSGRLVKDDLMKNAAGRIVSKKKHAAGKNALKFLHAKGYIAVKGKFGSARKLEGGSTATTATAATATAATEATSSLKPDLEHLDPVSGGVGVGSAGAAVEAGGQ